MDAKRSHIWLGTERAEVQVEGRSTYGAATLVRILDLKGYVVARDVFK